MKINDLVKQVHETAKEKGWWDGTPRSPLEIHMLAVSEIAEATECVREDNPAVFQNYDVSSDDNHIMKFSLNGKTCLVDERDWEKLKKFSWYVSSDGLNEYLKANINGTSISFHNAVVNPEDGLVVDHIDGNMLNNLRSNLRACTPSQNQANQKLQRRDKTSKFKGVYFSSIKGKWISQIGVEGKRIHIGNYDSEEAAALAYDAKAVQYFGQYARTNILKTSSPKIKITPKDLRWSPDQKIEGEAVELVDAVIRIMDYFGYRGWDMEQVIEAKMRYNETRSHRHGGKKY